MVIYSALILNFLRILILVFRIQTQNYSSNGEDGFYNYCDNIFSPKIFVLGSSYSFIDKMKIYLAYGNYDFKEEYNRKWKAEIRYRLISEVSKGSFLMLT